ncbi:hypothetical protein C0583_00475 [Candidatus Parcubacteria bacterium]|nr:MAG: hypothetical protein C0583_00475 [Candidatus Parcubacteria bacterium]
MANCECLEKCPFFNDKMADNDGLCSMYKTKFCQGDFAGCARYMIFKKLGKESVPKDLYPNMTERAQKILAV